MPQSIADDAGFGKQLQTPRSLFRSSRSASLARFRTSPRRNVVSVADRNWCQPWRETLRLRKRLTVTDTEDLHDDPRTTSERLWCLEFVCSPEQGKASGVPGAGMGARW